MITTVDQIPPDESTPIPATDRSTPGPVPAREGLGRRDGGDRREADGRDGRRKPVPARDFPGPADASAEPGPEPEEVEALIEVESVTWRARVLGRSGRASRGAPPLLLLGFWRAGAEQDTPELEATVVARTLAELTEDRLLAALAGATPPPSPDRPRSFFDTGHGGKRRRPESGV
jgi:hypothetical protein